MRWLLFPATPCTDQIAVIMVIEQTFTQFSLQAVISDLARAQLYETTIQLSSASLSTGTEAKLGSCLNQP